MASGPEDEHDPSSRYCNAVNPALTGAMDWRIVNITDDAPTSIYELVGLVCETMGPSSDTLINPRYLQMNGSLARSLGFRRTARTVYQTAQEALL